MNDALATKHALLRRKCAHDDVCPVCGLEVETVEHMLLLCPWANRCWFGCSLSLQIDKSQVVNFKKWCVDLLLANKAISEEGKALIAAICWGIWKGRCDWVFNEVRVDAEKVINVATMLVREVWSAKANNVEEGGRGVKRRLERKVKWEAPAEGTVKINADGAFLNSSNCAGVGIVCRDSVGSFLGGLGRRVKAYTAFEAECLAVREALLACSRFHMQNCCIEIDCEELYRHLLAGSAVGVEWQSVPLLEDIFLLIEERPGVGFSLVARQGNCAADYLAAVGSRGVEPQGWLETAPTLLAEFLMADSVRGKYDGNAVDGSGDREGIG